jgi:DNA-binding transcriptional regulator GbsR (MarR family)
VSSVSLAAQSVPPAALSAPLTEFEREMSAIFADLTPLLGLPASYGQIYGLLYGSMRPLSFGEIESKLALSKGSVSQGLRALREVGAIRLHTELDSRRDYFSPETELRQLVAAFLRESVQPHLGRGSTRLTALKKTLSSAGADPEERRFRSGRVEKLRSWHRQAGIVLPIVTKLLG